MMRRPVENIDFDGTLWLRAHRQINVRGLSVVKYQEVAARYLTLPRGYHPTSVAGLNWSRLHGCDLLL